MTEQELVREGIELMLIGMGTVFVFLTALVIATRLMSRAVALFPGDTAADVPPAERAAESAANPAAPGVHPDVVAAIAAAIRRHRQRGGRD